MKLHYIHNINTHIYTHIYTHIVTHTHRQGWGQTEFKLTSRGWSWN